MPFKCLIWISVAALGKETSHGRHRHLQLPPPRKRSKSHRRLAARSRTRAVCRSPGFCARFGQEAEPLSPREPRNLPPGFLPSCPEGQPVRDRKSISAGSREEILSGCARLLPEQRIDGEFIAVWNRPQQQLKTLRESERRLDLRLGWPRDLAIRQTRFGSRCSCLDSFAPSLG